MLAGGCFESFHSSLPPPSPPPPFLSLSPSLKQILASSSCLQHALFPTSSSPSRTPRSELQGGGCLPPPPPPLASLPSLLPARGREGGGGGRSDRLLLGGAQRAARRPGARRHPWKQKAIGPPGDARFGLAFIMEPPPPPSRPARIALLPPPGGDARRLLLGFARC